MSIQQEGAPVQAGPEALPITPPGTGVNAQPSDQAPAMYPEDIVVNLRREAAAYRQRAQALEGLHEDDLAVLDPLLGAIRAGRQDLIQSWVDQQYQLQHGGEQPQYQQQYQEQEQQTPLTRAEFAEMMRERDEQQQQMQYEAHQEQQRNELIQRVNSEFREAGLDPASPIAAAVARKVSQLSIDMNRPVSVADAYAALRVELGLAGGTPTPGVPPAPNGTAVGGIDRYAGMDASEAARAKTLDILRARQG